MEAPDGEQKSTARWWSRGGNPSDEGGVMFELGGFSADVATEVALEAGEEDLKVARDI